MENRQFSSILKIMSWNINGINNTEGAKSKDNDFLNILRNIQNNPKTSQRNLAKRIGLSLGKLNYCLNALRAKGLVKLKNFSSSFITSIISPLTKGLDILVIPVGSRLLPPPFNAL